MTRKHIGYSFRVLVEEEDEDEDSMATAEDGVRGREICNLLKASNWRKTHLDLAPDGWVG